MARFASQKGDKPEALQKCLECYQACLQTAALGLEMNEDQEFITALQLCAQTCQLSAQAILLDSAFRPRLGAVCSDLCESVADLCDGFDEIEIRECGKICRECAQACRDSFQHSASNQSFQSDIRLV